MDSTFKKMNFKLEPEVLVLQAPERFGPNMQAMAGLTTFQTDISQVEKIRFAIAFVTRQEEIDAYMEAMAGKLEGDCAIWFCYPKGLRFLHIFTLKKHGYKNILSSKQSRL